MLPEKIERDYMHFRARIMHDVGRIAVPKLAASHALRNDAADDPRVVEIATMLGISSAGLLNKAKLRAKLRRLASRLSVEKQVQLSRLLGRWVPAPSQDLVEQWVESQVEAVSTQVDGWIAGASIALASVAVTGNVFLASSNQVITPEDAQAAVALTAAAQATRARQAASSALLSLNTQLLGDVSAANGIGSYLWVTEDDDVVRENHAELHFTIQQWADPPLGGGTKPDDEGHPGSGFGCRCEAQPAILPR